MSRLTPIAFALAAAFATGCAAVPKILACQNAAQWFVNDKVGKPASAVMICFADDHSLRWNARPVTADEARALQPQPPAKTAAPGGAPPTPRPIHKRGAKALPLTSKPAGVQ